jgi:hypothetical protein
LSDLRLLIFAFAIRAASALGDCFICAAIFAAFVDCGCATVSAPCSIGCTFMGPVAGGRSLAIPDNARGWPLVSFLLPFLVRMHRLGVIPARFYQLDIVNWSKARRGGKHGPATAVSVHGEWTGGTVQAAGVAATLINWHF